jgi:hypothetical protein
MDTVPHHDLLSRVLLVLPPFDVASPLSQIRVVIDWSAPIC